jgi:hypothetical protein
MFLNEKLYLSGKWKEDEFYEGTKNEFSENIQELIQYKGNFLDEKPHGNCVKTITINGNKVFEYKGEWKNGFMTGFGKWWKFEGTEQIYEGNFENDLFQGKGTLTVILGDEKVEEYQSNCWVQGYPQEGTKILFKDAQKMTIVYEYVGQFSGFEFNGKGKQTMGSDKISSDKISSDKISSDKISSDKISSGYYEGDWVDGKKSGKGIQIFSEQDLKYEGSFKDDYFEGFGIIYIKSDKVYEGNFKNGQKHEK